MQRARKLLKWILKIQNSENKHLSDNDIYELWGYENITTMVNQNIVSNPIIMKDYFIGEFKFTILRSENSLNQYIFVR